MSKLILNENNYLLNVLKDHDKNKVDISETQLAFLLTKKYRDYDKVIEEMEKFNFEKYCEIKWYDTIHKFCDIVINYDLKLKNYEYIPLYEHELENIKKCKKDKYKKLLFTIYILARYKNKELKNKDNFYRIDKTLLQKDLFDCANIRCTKKDKALMINELWKDGYIEQSFINDDVSISVELNNQGKEVMKITNLDNLGNQILAYLKPNYKQCSICGKLIRIKGRNSQYCEQCLLKREKELKQIRNQKYYEIHK